MTTKVSAQVLRLYQKHPFQASHIAKVTDIIRDKFGLLIRLNETIFHPKGGGQLNDQGTIEGIKVKAVFNSEDGKEINHYLEFEEDKLPFCKGDEVKLEIDLEKRKQNAALHSAGHVLAALAEKSFPQIYPKKAHHYPKEARVTFQQKDKTLPLKKEEIQSQLEKDMREAIAKKIAIKELIDAAGERKIQVGDSSAVGCGGTHLKHAGQIKDFFIRNVRIKKGEINVGYDASFNPENL